MSLVESKPPAPRKAAPVRTVAKVCLIIVALFLVAACKTNSDSGANSKKGNGTNRPPADRASLLVASQKTDWLRFGFDPARSGVNHDETIISPENVDGLHRLWQTQLPGVADSSPILLHDLKGPRGTRDELYATTKNGSIVALDAATGEILWSHRPAGPQITTSSPVADPAKGLVYSYGLDGMLHRYSATTGRESKGDGWPVRITRMPETEKGSSALNIANGKVYATTSGYLGDTPPYQGHVVAVDEATGASNVFNSLCSAGAGHLLSATECSSQHSGIWARGGAVVDSATGSVFATTGNGPFDANTGGQDYGDSVLRLGADNLRLLGSYTPETYHQLQVEDADLGSTAPALLPKIPGSKSPRLLVQGGKDGKLRLIERKNPGGEKGTGHVGGEVQEIKSAGCATFTQPVVWTDREGRVWTIVAGTCGIAGYQISADSGGTPRLHLSWKTGDTSTSPVIAGGVLFAATSGALLALDPETGDRLWSSAQGSAGGTIGGIHWESPIAVNGRLYVSDESGAMTAYGLPAS